MGNTQQRDNKKNKYCFFPVIFPFYFKNQFRYVNTQNSDKVPERVSETRCNKSRPGELSYMKTMDDNTINNTVKYAVVMNTSDPIQDQTKFVNNNVGDCYRPSIGERGHVSNANSSNSNKFFSNCKMMSHLQDNKTDKSLNIASSNVVSLNTQDQETSSTLSMVSFSSLWLPFRSPFRRAVFSAGSKVATQPNLKMLSEEGTHQRIPMASSSILQTPGQFQFSTWAHHNQSPESNPMVMGHKQGDVLMQLPNNSSCHESLCNAEYETLHCSKGNIVENAIDKCCSGFPPSLFQSPPNLFTSESYPKSDCYISIKQDTKQVIDDNRKKSVNKQGTIAIKLNRRGRNDIIMPREQQLNQRLKKKKQRAAHQASSPSSSTNLNRYSSLNTSLSRNRDASPPPFIRIINDLKVTMIDEQLKVFVVDLLTPETCNLVRQMTNEHVKRVIDSGSNIATWRTLYTYTKRDLPCSEVKGLTSYVTDHIMASIIDIVGTVFDKKEDAAKLHPRSWKEPHLLSYIKLEGQTPHTGVEMHYDGCDITWNCMLSKSSEYDGGGTYIRALRKTVRLEQGQVLVHPGELYHKGCDITRGKRDLIVCFMDGFDPHIVDTSSAQEDRVIYEKNVRSY